MRRQTRTMECIMRSLFAGVAALLASVIFTPPAHADDTVKLVDIASYSDVVYEDLSTGFRLDLLNTTSGDLLVWGTQYEASGSPAGAAPYADAWVCTAPNHCYIYADSAGNAVDTTTLTVLSEVGQSLSGVTFETYDGVNDGAVFFNMTTVPSYVSYAGGGSAPKAKWRIIDIKTIGTGPWKTITDGACVGMPGNRVSASSNAKCAELRDLECPDYPAATCTCEALYEGEPVSLTVHCDAGGPPGSGGLGSAPIIVAGP